VRLVASVERIPIYGHLYAYNVVRASGVAGLPIGVCGGFRVQLGKESRARKQFAAKYGRESLRLSVFGRNGRVSEGELNAKILSNLALDGPTWLYELRTKIRDKTERSDILPHYRTFTRHAHQLWKLGYIKVLKQERHHAGIKRTYTLTEKGKAVVLFLPEVRRNLVRFLDLYDTEDQAATPGGRTLRLLMEKDIRTLAEYVVRATNMGMLIYNFEDEEDEGRVWEIRLAALAGVLLDLERRKKQGEPPPSSISQDDLMKYDNAMRNDPVFRKSAIELIEGMKEGMEHWQDDIKTLLTELRRLGASRTR